MYTKELGTISEEDSSLVPAVSMRFLKEKILKSKKTFE